MLLHGYKTDGVKETRVKLSNIDKVLLHSFTVFYFNPAQYLLCSVCEWIHHCTTIPGRAPPGCASLGSISMNSINLSNHLLVCLHLHTWILEIIFFSGHKRRRSCHDRWNGKSRNQFSNSRRVSSWGWHSWEFPLRELVSLFTNCFQNEEKKFKTFPCLSRKFNEYILFKIFVQMFQSKIVNETRLGFCRDSRLSISPVSSELYNAMIHSLVKQKNCT